MPETVARLTYRAFISYSHADKAWADWLHKALETYRVPSRLVGKQTEAGVIPRRLNPVFRDREELSSSPELGSKINQALAQSENLIVICSPAAAASRWVNEEVLAYKRMGRGARIFCLIVAGEPNASGSPSAPAVSHSRTSGNPASFDHPADLPSHWIPDIATRFRDDEQTQSFINDAPDGSAEECFCPVLRFQLGTDGQPTSERTEPIAADARPGKDGKTNAKLKLVAGMLGVGFDALKQRELQRRTRRMTAITALAVCVMAITSVLAVYALVSRHEAVIAQHEAVVAKQAAQRRQKQAEGLVGFMLGDLNDKLNQVHRLDIMQAVDDKALAYFASLPPADATDTELEMRVTALDKIGDVRASSGNIHAALKAHRDALALAAELSRRDPANVKRQVGYATALLWIGNDDWYLGDLAHAGHVFEKAANVLTKAAAAKPDDADLADQLGTALLNTGRVLEAQGEYASAKPYYEASLKIYAGLSRREPQKSIWQTYWGDAYGNLGMLALEQGQLDRAITLYAANQRIEARLAAHAPDDHNQVWELVTIDGMLGRALLLAGQLDEAKRHLGDAVGGARKLATFDPKDTDYHYLHARYSEQLGGVLRQMKQLDQAATCDDDSLHALRGLVAKDPGNTKWQQELAASELESARLALARRRAGDAASLTASALDTIKSLQAKASLDHNLMLLAAQAHIVAAQVAAQSGDAATARGASQLALKSLSPIPQSSADVHVLAARATALLEFDEATAQPVIAKLAAVGYRTPDFIALTTAKGIDFAPRRIAMDTPHQ